MIMTKTFWASTVEASVKAAAAAALGVIGASQFLTVTGVDWAQVGGVAVLAAIVSILTAIVAPNPDVRAARKEARAEAILAAEAEAKKAARRKVAKK